MPIGTVSGASSASANLQANGLGMQDFMKILLTQLTYQDPLKPMDNQQFIAQMAQFSALQQTEALNEKIDQLISTQASLQAVGLIGKTVTVGTANGTVSGTVSSLSFAGSSPQLTLTTQSGAALSGIALSQITAVN
jgi:flagellar basal-body rod modification protein FlgD